MHVVDVSDRTAPELLGTADTPGDAFSLAVAGDFSYVVCEDWGLQVVDVSDPTAPWVVGYVYTPDWAIGIALAGDHAFVAARAAGLQVIDISTPSSPTIVGSLATPDWAIDVKVYGDVAYLCDNETGLLVVDISTPTTPVIIGTVNTPGCASDVVVDGHYAYISDFNAGLQIADVTNLTAPRLVGSVDTPYHSAHSIALSGDRVCIADWASGLQIAWKQCEPVAVPPEETPVRSQPLMAYPNPFNPATTFAFSLTERRYITLAVFDTRGRKVDTVFAGDLDAGRHEFAWDARGFASGVYCCRLEAGGLVSTEKVVLAK
jgi:hypothetical protein